MSTFESTTDELVKGCETRINLNKERNMFLNKIYYKCNTKLGYCDTCKAKIAQKLASEEMFKEIIRSRSKFFEDNDNQYVILFVYDLVDLEKSITKLQGALA